jgi:hypothetical protein
MGGFARGGQSNTKGEFPIEDESGSHTREHEIADRLTRGGPTVPHRKIVRDGQKAARIQRRSSHEGEGTGIFEGDERRRDNRKWGDVVAGGCGFLVPSCVGILNAGLSRVLRPSRAMRTPGVSINSKKC